MNQYNFRGPIYHSMPNKNDDRFIGPGFLAPFLLGGITGGLLAPSFYPRPIYGPIIYPPYPVYNGPFYQNTYPIYR